MNCKRCGALLENNSTFCKLCGTPVDLTEVHQPELIQQQAPGVQPELVQQQVPGVQPGLVQQQAPGVQPELIQQQVPRVQPELVQQQVPGVQPELVQQQVPGVQPELIQQQAPGVQPELVQQQVSEVHEDILPNPQLEQLNTIKQKEINPMGLELPAFEPIQDNEIPKKKHSILPIIIILLLLFGLGGFIAYKYFFASSNRVVSSIVNATYNKLEKMIDESKTINIEEKSVIVTGDLVLDTNIEGLEDLKDIKLNYVSGIDYKNKKMEFGGSISEGSVKIIDMIMYLLDNKAYLSLKDDYSGLLKIDTVDNNFDDLMKVEKSNLTKADIKFILKTYKDILLESLDMNDFKESSGNIVISGKEMKVSKFTYEVNGENIKKLSNKIIDKTLQDQELLSTLAKISDETVEQIKLQLEQSKITDESNISNFIINFYTKGITNDFVGMDIVNDEIGNILIRIDNNSTVIDLKNGDELLATYVLTSDDKGSFAIEFETFKDNKVKGLISLMCKEIDTENFEGTIKINVNSSDQSFTVLSNYTMKIGAVVADVDVSDAKAMEELTEEEQNQLYMKIISRLEDSKLYNLINSFFGFQDYGSYGETNSSL